MPYRKIEGWTALAGAVYNHDEEMVNLLLQRGASVDARGSAAAPTPLMNAAWNGDLQMVESLMEDHHADPRLKFQSEGNGYE